MRTPQHCTLPNLINKPPYNCAKSPFGVRRDRHERVLLFLLACLPNPPNLPNLQTSQRTCQAPPSRRGSKSPQSVPEGSLNFCCESPVFLTMHYGRPYYTAPSHRAKFAMVLSSSTWTIEPRSLRTTSEPEWRCARLLDWAAEWNGSEWELNPTLVHQLG